MSQIDRETELLTRSSELLKSLEATRGELETLKAQLAMRDQSISLLRDRWVAARTDATEAEAQVRELRELIGIVISVRRLPDILPLIVVERLEKAALRSAPPSGPTIEEMSGSMPSDWCDATMAEITDRTIEEVQFDRQARLAASQALFAKTDAGEERKDLAVAGHASNSSYWGPAEQDLARVPAARTDETQPVESAPLGELTARSGDGNQSPTQKARVGPQDSPSRSPISIEVFQQDWMPGFAAFRNDGSLEDGAKAHVCLNLSSFLGGVQIGELTAADLPYLIAESIMHEVMHVLEAWANVGFSEERVEALLTKYRDKYHPEAPRYEVCEERQMPEKQAFGSSRPQTIFTQINHAEGLCSGCMNISYEFGDDEIHITCNQCGASVKTTVPLPSAPPSPAREKEKAE